MNPVKTFRTFNAVHTTFKAAHSTGIFRHCRCFYTEIHCDVTDRSQEQSDCGCFIRKYTVTDRSQEQSDLVMAGLRIYRKNIMYAQLRHIQTVRL